MAEINQIDFGNGTAQDLCDTKSRILLPATVGWTGKNLFGDLVIGKSIDNTGAIVTDAGGWMMRNPITPVFSTIGVTLLDSDYKNSFCIVQYDSSDQHIDADIVIQCNLISYPYYHVHDLDPSCAYIRVKGWGGTANVNKILTARFQVSQTTVADPIYEPYHKSVEECKADNTVIAPVESGTTASKAYVIGEHFIRNGAFCTAIAAIASGATLTENTNYKTGNISKNIITIGQYTGTTSASGNITETGLYASSTLILSAYVLGGSISSNAMVVPFIRGSDNTWGFNVKAVTGETIGNTSVTIQYTYIKI